MEKDHRKYHRSLSLLLVEIMEPKNNTQDQTDKSVKKLVNMRKRKSIEPLENQFDSPIRRDKYIEKELNILKSNQQLILEKLEMLTNLIENNKQYLPNPCQLKPTLPGSSVDECIHGEVLQENLKMLVRDMDLSNGLIIDEMLQNGSLTDNEAQEIKELSRPDKTRKLATVLGRSNKTKFKNFLRLIEENEFYPHIANILSQSYEKKLRAQGNHPNCTRCFIIKNVSVKHILDHLCENHVIGLHEVSYLIKGDSRDVDKFWCDIFKKMEHPIFGENCVSVFADSLKTHYPHIAKRVGGNRHMKCLCTATIMSYPSGSAGNASELSTTSTIIPKSKIQKRQNSYQSEGSIGDSSDISTSTVIPEPKPETQEWIQRHHGFSEEIVKKESCEIFMYQIQNKFDNYETERQEPYTNMKIKNPDFPYFGGDVVECEDIRFEDYESPYVEFLEEKTIVNDKKKRINRTNPLPVFISPVSQIYRESHSNENKTGSSSIAPNSYEKEPTLFKTPNKMPRHRTKNEIKEYLHFLKTEMLYKDGAIIHQLFRLSNKNH